MGARPFPKDSPWWGSGKGRKPEQGRTEGQPKVSHTHTHTPATLPLLLLSRGPSEQRSRAGSGPLWQPRFSEPEANRPGSEDDRLSPGGLSKWSPPTCQLRYVREWDSWKHAASESWRDEGPGWGFHCGCGPFTLLRSTQAGLGSSL